MINWIKKGMLFDPRGRHEWMMAYAQVPTVYDTGDRYRIFFTCRPNKDANGQFISYTSYLELAKSDPFKTLYVHDKPVLKVGEAGSFDEFGIHPCSIIDMGDLTYFYYQGWTRMASVPYQTSLGLAVSKDKGKTFEKFSKGPLFSRTPNEPYLENGFFVSRIDNALHMWYSTAREWLEVNGKVEPVYVIVHATSSDGIIWQRENIPCIKAVYQKEANGRPCVVKIGKTFHMWFCYRNVENFRTGEGAYRIGHAISSNLRTWQRKDNVDNITVSTQGWDSEMVAYPSVVKERHRLLLFYNGNSFGKYGFGYAQADLI